jgi:hypothetical protein
MVKGEGEVFGQASAGCEFKISKQITQRQHTKVNRTKVTPQNKSHEGDRPN